MNLDFPFHFNSLGRTALTGDNDHIRDLIEQFLFTNPGERVNRPDFGSGPLQVVFAPNSPELAAVLQYTIQAGLQRWLDDLIEVHELEVESRESSVFVKLTYLVRRTGQTTSQAFVRTAGRTS